MSAAATLLRQYLQQQADRGVSHVPVTSHALAALGALGKRQPKPRAAEPSPRPEPAADSPDLAPPRSAAPAGKTSALIDAPGASREEKLAHLAALAENCEAARALGTLRQTMVFAVGDPHASLMFIGEAPGADEERQREPFVGKAGQLLTRIITAMGLERSQVYISNICKFRPQVDGSSGSANRPPTAKEMASCLPFILTEIDIVRPRVIIALGGTAIAGLGIEGSVSKNRGREHSIQGIPVVATYHPSYLVRQEENADQGRGDKRKCWEDMLRAMEIAGMTITAKQRGYIKGK